ncbi:MAG TPA: DUF222 domain-containing protein [Galbitalea sp.]|jgi:hypothetical protein
MANRPVFEPREVGFPRALPDVQPDVQAHDMQPHDMLSVVVGIDREINRLIAARTHALELAHREAEERSLSGARSLGGGGLEQGLGERSFRAEVATALRMSERAAENLIAHARILCSDLPATLGALGVGTISYRHATIMVDESLGLDELSRKRLERTVLDTASTFTPPKFARVARMARERMNPESIVGRQAKARDARGIALDDHRDGVSSLTVTLASASAHAIFARLTGAAHQLRLADDDRTLDQRRADVFVAVMLAKSGALPFAVVPDEADSEEFTAWFRGIAAQVVVSVPVLTLLGQSNEPGMLDGRVPIDPETARNLAGTAKSFIRILTHPETGATLSVGRRRYKVPKDLTTYLRIRDLTCRFPGCSMGAARCDIDHTLDWQFEGATSHDNLAHLCRGHHTLKGASEWSVRQAAETAGVLTWRAPSGREYVSYPEDPVGH